METKKIYRINDKIENIKEVEEVAKGIVLKALKVIETSGNRWATNIIEKRDVDTFEDLVQTVCLKLVENNLVVSKECYKTVNKYLNNYKLEKSKNIEIVIDENSNSCNVDKQSYIQYLKEENNSIENNEYIKKITLDKLELTERQKEILNIYSSNNSMSKTAEILGIGKSTVQVTIERIRNKTIKLVECLEF